MTTGFDHLYYPVPPLSPFHPHDTTRHHALSFPEPLLAPAQRRMISQSVAGVGIFSSGFSSRWLFLLLHIMLLCTARPLFGLDGIFLLFHTTTSLFPLFIAATKIRTSPNPNNQTNQSLSRMRHLDVLRSATRPFLSKSCVSLFSLLQLLARSRFSRRPVLLVQRAW
ncbi:uncharacterized protein IWZ02DRAFT_14141 [Phyllosticta citriasiana]|uniref:uncharacterized protein n=1 Tax=Phyllosticta citriasiana TaxID=595635 RepID=UPI0030FDF60F